ncbi:MULTISPECIES: succinate--CoA ligase subunit beta [unclassified Hydrogenobaculum]|jgi:Succinyl-CoA synthetase, beta subunit|uniref:succinate--CoA ligase subunit beta n=1 Tax=unclassified Hydrogenobaculum TaxID=2622382 RepID=UPI0001C5132E|nr:MULTISPECIES: succinate--CoA ligase subunit beta [unclassified Hydrogenobaculum]AEF19636.1 Succinate--CoA ligase (ADP-forming) [Hydrogenobaculum sp. 3684]AEG46924.1 Succinate--CoA ligase (ADP-forming) [Hydrogenobaculum sp. SHO]AGG15571.1 Succinate--CoA ligase (ADP-forming) [Hydrogenobaculum sp. HO]AGH93870.1 succinyl-CoA synthetase, beta subunit [Hydrogenobaculum sp. SN]
MNLYEFEAYDKIFKKYGVPVLNYMYADHINDDLKDFANKLGESVVKSQVLVGKRGKAGAVKLCKTPEEAIETAEALLQYPVYGEMPVGIIIAEKAKILKELYASITYSTETRTPVLVLSLEGGMDIEEVPPEKVKTFKIDPLIGLYPYMVREYLMDMGFPKEYIGVLRELSEVIANLYKAFWETEAKLIEINPLAICDVNGKQKIYALDAVVTIDDDASVPPSKIYGVRSAMKRPPTQREIEASLIDRDDHRGKAGSYVEMDGDIALMTFGGGGSTVTIETCYNIGLKPANFTDIGGNPPAEKMYKITRIILSKPGIRGVLVCGGTANNTRIDVTLGEGVANAIRDLKKEGKLDPNWVWVVRRNGPEAEKGLRMLYEAFKECGVKGEIYDSSLPLTEAPVRLKYLLEHQVKSVNDNVAEDLGV